jgi:hypothetical protein
MEVITQLSVAPSSLPTPPPDNPLDEDPPKPEFNYTDSSTNDGLPSNSLHVPVSSPDVVTPQGLPVSCQAEEVVKTGEPERSHPSVEDYDLLTTLG